MVQNTGRTPFTPDPSRPPPVRKNRAKTEINKERMVENVKKDSDRVRASKPLPSRALTTSGDGIALDKRTLIQNVKTEKKARPSVSPTRQIAGGRIYHYKGDILPWMTNMFDSGQLSCDYIKDQLVKSENPTLAKIVQEETAQAKEELKLKERQKLQIPELSEDLNTELLPDKEIVNKYKNISKSVESSVHETIEKCLQNILTRSMKAGVSKEDIQEAEELARNVPNIEGLKRYELIHRDPLWQPGYVTTGVMALTSSKTGKNFKGVSTFQAIGPGYSSQAPRNRTAADACPANFLRSTWGMNPEGERETEILLDYTRSAITVEFDQKDKNERKKATMENVKQVVDQQVAHWLEGIDPARLEGNDKEHPLEFKGQTVNLLTPDILRSLTRQVPLLAKIGKNISHDITGAPADDERALALENLEAHKALNGKVMEYKIKVGDEEKTIFIKYELRFFNISNNKLDERLPFWLKTSFEKTNKESWEKLEKDVFEQETMLRDKYIEAYDNAAGREQTLLDEVERQMDECIDLRLRIVNEAKKIIRPDDKQFTLWKNKADALAENLLKLEDSSESSEELKKAVAILKKRILLLDLYLDSKELFVQETSKNLNNVDQNRSAFPARILLLAILVDDLQVHFGCRSGKDRTGLVDIELKLLASEAVLNGRLPSYREQEKLPDTANLREVVMMQSENVFGIVKGNLGASVGMRISGASSNPLEENAYGEQLKELNAGAEAFAKIATRPPTSWVVPSAHRDYWQAKKEEPIVIRRTP